MTVEDVADRLAQIIVDRDPPFASAKETILAVLREVVAAEREACAKVADGYHVDNAYGDGEGAAAVWKAAGEIASEIRARGS